MALQRFPHCNGFNVLFPQCNVMNLGPLNLKRSLLLLLHARFGHSNIDYGPNGTLRNVHELKEYSNLF